MKNKFNYSGNFKIDFVIAGQPKSGTTALAHFLSQHPQICFSVPKEPGFFASDIIAESDAFHGRKRYFKFRSLEEYSKIFDCENPRTLKGEATTSYLYSKSAAQNIYTNNPDAKIVIMLRNPVDFLHSLHMQMVNEDIENVDFKTALKLEEARKQGNSLPSKVRYPSALYYSERIKYSQQMKRYFKLFDPENIKVLIMEEFKKNNERYYKEVLEFLDIDTSFTPEFSRVRSSRAPRHWLLKKAVHILWLKNLLFKILGAKWYTALAKFATKIALKKSARDPLDPKLRAILNQEFEPKVQLVCDLLGKDLFKVWGMD